MRISDWSSDVCSSDLCPRAGDPPVVGGPAGKSEHTQAITFAQTPDVRDTEEGAHARAAQAPTVSAGEPVGLEDEGAGADRLMLLSRRDWHLKLRSPEMDYSIHVRTFQGTLHSGEVPPSPVPRTAWSSRVFPHLGAAGGFRSRALTRALRNDDDGGSASRAGILLDSPLPPR